MAAVLSVWLGIVISMIYLPFAEDEPSWPRSILKTLPLLFFGWSAIEQGSSIMLIEGLFLSALGDLALSRRGEKAFVIGLSAFAVAHMAYILHFLAMSGAPLTEAFRENLPLSIFLVAYALSAEVWLIPYTGKLKLAVRIYVVLITLMGLAALTMPMGMPFLGAAFFILSDTLLAYLMFRMDQENPLSGRLGWAVWISYIAGQALILAA